MRGRELAVRARTIPAWHQMLRIHDTQVYRPLAVL